MGLPEPARRSPVRLSITGCAPPWPCASSPLDYHALAVTADDLPRPDGSARAALTCTGGHRLTRACQVAVGGGDYLV